MLGFGGLKNEQKYWVKTLEYISQSFSKGKTENNISKFLLSEDEKKLNNLDKSEINISEFNRINQDLNNFYKKYQDKHEFKKLIYLTIRAYSLSQNSGNIFQQATSAVLGSKDSDWKAAFFISDWVSYIKKNAPYTDEKIFRNNCRALFNSFRKEIQILLVHLFNVIDDNKYNNIDKLADKTIERLKHLINNFNKLNDVILKK